MPVTVYVVQESPGKNIVPAREFGEIKVLLPPGQVAFSSGPTLRRLRHELRDYVDGDYILPIGDPVAIAMAAMVASTLNRGVVNFLKWDRQEKMYYPVHVSLYKGESENDD
jgi:hypothetical protein